MKRRKVTKSVIKSEPKHDPTSKSRSGLKSDPNSSSKANLKADPEVHSKTDPKMNPKPGTKSNAQAEPPFITKLLTHRPTQLVLWLALLLLTVFSRFYDLTNKPIHFDEGINGWFVLRMFQIGFYKYDPNNYHGPLFFYILQIFESLWGVSLEIIRSVPAVFSVLAVMIFSYRIVRSHLWNYWMIFFIFLSPAFLFYGRSGIHEMPFVFFQILMALGFLRWLERQDARALALVLVGAFGMITLKETFAVSFACWFIAFLTLGWTQLKTSFAPKTLAQVWNRPLTWLVLMLLFLLVGLFGGFGRNPQGLLDFFRAFLPWLKTGVDGHGHDKSFIYWFKVVASAEPLVLVGMLCSIFGVFARDKALRLLSVFSLLQFLIYSLIPYKTVWCILTLVWGFYFVLAMSLEKILLVAKPGKFLAKAKWLLFLAILLAMPAEVDSIWSSVYRQPIQMSHPFVYVNSTYAFKDFLAMVQQVLNDHPELRTMPIQVGMKEQWPLPWSLRLSRNLRYDLISDRLIDNSLIYFAEIGDETKIEPHLTKEYIKLSMDIRQARTPSVIYLDREVFAPYYKDKNMGSSIVVGHNVAPVGSSVDGEQFEEE